MFLIDLVVFVFDLFVRLVWLISETGLRLFEWLAARKKQDKPHA